MVRALRRGIIALALGCAPPAALGAAALEFRAVGEPVAVLYDAPSAKSTRLFVVNRGYPLEILVALTDWTKVRDATGAMAWIETRHLTDRRTVMVRVPVADVRREADENAPLVFQAQQNVVLDLVAVGSGGWIQIRHPEGGTGFVRTQHVWGI
jgi:SH3-like domain-containing protein